MTSFCFNIPRKFPKIWTLIIFFKPKKKLYQILILKEKDYPVFILSNNFMIELLPMVLTQELLLWYIYLLSSSFVQILVLKVEDYPVSTFSNNFLRIYDRVITNDICCVLTTLLWYICPLGPCNKMNLWTITIFTTFNYKYVLN